MKKTGDGFVAWSDVDIAAFLKHWSAGTRERLALSLLLYTAQRRGDVVRMGSQHVHGDTIHVVQSKTGAQLVIPMHPELRRVLDGAQGGAATFLATTRGKPFSPETFGNWLHDACEAAGLSGRSAHGLRRTASSRLAEAGCTTKQIQSITGHSSIREVERYTKAADQERLARQAIARLIGTAQPASMAKPSGEVSNCQKKPIKINAEKTDGGPGGTRTPNQTVMSGRL